MFQVIVQIESWSNIPFENKLRPFRWISSTSEEIDDALVEKLAKYAVRDMNFDKAELDRLVLFINEAEASGQKKTYFTLNDNESISIEILNQADIDAREKTTRELLDPREKFSE